MTTQLVGYACEKPCLIESSTLVKLHEPVCGIAAVFLCPKFLDKSRDWTRLEDFTTFIVEAKSEAPQP